jgi:anti-sigma factor RsiW
MKQKEVKSILGAARPNGADAQDPQVAAALAEVGKDAELSAWYSKLRSFDAAMAACVQAIPVPAHLKASLLAAPCILPLPFWRRGPVRLALAACLAGLLLVGGLVLAGRPVKFADVRRVITEQAREGIPQPKLQSADIHAIREWLHQNNAPADFVVPAGLRDIPIAGASICERRGRTTASLIFFTEGGRRFHLFVIDAKAFRDAPLLDFPEFEVCGGWKTASWTHDGNAYVLSGMRNTTFVKRFRKSGHWQVAG